MEKKVIKSLWDLELPSAAKASTRRYQSRLTCIKDHFDLIEMTKNAFF
jgi:hypothetical protein